MVTRRTFVKGLAAPLIGKRKPPEDRPNIVIFVADSLGFSDAGCYGSEIRTPNLDGLARRGLRFSSFYVMPGGAGTRAALLTGIGPHQAGVGARTDDLHRPAYRGTLNRGCACLSELLRNAGYRCYAAGKWQLANSEQRDNWPLQRGFQEFYGTLGGPTDYFRPANLYHDNDRVAAPDQGYYHSDVISDYAVRWLARHASQYAADPFLLYLSYPMPHWPLQAPESETGRYRDVYRAGWDALRRARYKRLQDIGLIEDDCQLSPRPAGVPDWNETSNRDWEARRMSVYAAMVTRVDQGIGRVLDQIRKQGAEDGTLVLFLSTGGGDAQKPVPPRDVKPPNTARYADDPLIWPGASETYESYGAGWASLSNTPFRQFKGSVFEGGISSPLIAAWGDRVVNPGSITRQAASATDIAATCLDAAGVRYPKSHYGRRLQPVEGLSLLPVFDGRRRHPHQHLFWEYEGNRAMRDGKWKLAAAEGRRWELYNLDDDRSELNDLAAHDPRRVHRMEAAWTSWARQVGVVPWRELRPSAGPPAE